jgi:hypothetical protein
MQQIQAEELNKYFTALYQCGDKSYLLRTRLERMFVKVKSYGLLTHNEAVIKKVEAMENKLHYVCNSSHHAPTHKEGILTFYKDDIEELRHMINSDMSSVGEVCYATSC